MSKATKYTSETKIVPFGNGTITIINRTPILPPKEQERRRREVEKRLYSVLSKYAEKGR